MSYIHRSTEAMVRSTLADSKIAILYGPRQVGKTTLARYIAGSIDTNYRYWNCDEPDVALSLSGKTSTELGRRVGTSGTIVIDEAQRVENIGITLKLLADTFPELRIIATGSSSFELANAINEPLTGRAYYTTVWPLSISEITDGNELEAERIVNDLLVFGSYPVIALRKTTDILQYLGNLTKNYLYRDLLSHGVIRSEDTLVRLLKLLALQIGGKISLSSLARDLQIDVATVKRLVDLLEKAFIIHRLPSLTSNRRVGVRKSQKIYFTDLGVRNYLIGNMNSINLRTDTGALWENFCVNEIRKQRSASATPVNSYFWRDYAGAEVDYIEERDGSLFPYEFKWGKASARLPKAFQDNFQSDPLSVLSPKNMGCLVEKF